MNALATSLVQSNRLATIFGPPARASTTMRYSRDLWGNEKETPGVTPETESLILLIATLESRRKASAFFFLIPLFSSVSPRFSYFESSSAPWKSSFSSTSHCFLHCFSVERTRVEPWDERIDDDCRGPKINHVFFRVQGETGEREENKEQTCTGKRRDQASGRDSVTHTRSTDVGLFIWLAESLIKRTTTHPEEKCVRSSLFLVYEMKMNAPVPIRVRCSTQLSIIRQ